MMSAQVPVEVPAKETEAYPPPYAPDTSPNQQGNFVVQQQAYPPAYAPTYPPQGAVYPVVGQQQQTVVVTGGQIPVQNVVLVRPNGRGHNPQVAGAQPGPAFCLFAPGMIETGIRVSLVVGDNYSILYAS